MADLASMVQSALDAHAAGQPVDLVRSQQWLQVRQRYAELSVNLIVNGHESLAKRVDREYQALREALRKAVESSSGHNVVDDYALWEAVTEFQFTVGHLERLHQRIEDNAHIQPAKQLPKPPVANDPPKRSWTQEDLDEAIREYKAKRATSYQRILSMLDNPKAPPSAKRAARKQARETFGRNVIARALGVKSAKMVSQSQPWIAMSKELGLPRRAGKQTGAGRPKRVGEQFALEEASMEADDTNDHAAADASLLREEREETLRRIRALAESETPEAKSSAKAIYDRYEAGEMTDDQVRQTVVMLMNSAGTDLS
ncbi:hypothetical protein HED60_05800 [Planctomycetales bacterium ZRK34]|nr:hypothetical protein HED60_05800 [Planctomycetales bacterium ZRK34]